MLDKRLKYQKGIAMHPGLKKWLQDNIVASLALIVATVALVLPLANSQVAQNKALRASIVGIDDDSVVSGANHSVAVTYENKNEETDLWLVLRSGVEGRWYPVTRLVPEHGEASKGEVENLSVLLGSTGPFQLSVYATSPSQGMEFDAALKRISNGSASEGLNGLPEGLRPLYTASFTRSL